MKINKLAGALVTAFLAGFAVQPAEASCRDANTCNMTASQAKIAKVHRIKTASANTSRKPKRKAAGGTARLATSSAEGGRVVTLIINMAPTHGVPTWFALRIAKVESNYNPHARGSAGELGVFQLKCATARGIGYRGQCSGLLDARTNVQYGLKHLALAMKSSGGDLRLAASKHNGGLGRKKMVRAYVAKVF